VTSADLVEAWEEAARQWTAAGRPSLGDPADADEIEIGVEELVS